MQKHEKICLPMAFACSQGQHCTIPRSRSDLGDWQLYPNRRPGAVALNVLLPVSSNVLEEQQSAGKSGKVLERLPFFRYLRSPDHLADQFRSAA